MFKILSQISQHLREYLTFSALVLVSLILLSVGNSSKSHLVAQIAVEVVGVTKSITNIFSNFYDIQDENRKLRKTNILLLSELSQLLLSHLHLVLNHQVELRLLLQLSLLQSTHLEKERKHPKPQRYLSNHAPSPLLS